MVKEINLTIDGLQVCVPEGTTVMKAASTLGIEIPHLCYLEDINEISACKVCVVELQGKRKLITACNSKVEEGMIIYTNSPKVRRVRRTNVELILSQHDCHCATCVRSGNCALQTISNDLGILDVPYKEELSTVPWNQDFPLIRDAKKCIKCMRCVQVCDKVQNQHIWDVQNTGSRTTVDVADNITIEKSSCTLCGQCITHCPTGALRVRDDLHKVFDALADPDKVTVVQVAPAVRAAWGEALGLSREEATEGFMVAALKKIGFDYIFDTNFAADLTIMEEGNELLERLQRPEQYTWPMFTSCCPGWVHFIKEKHPDLLKNLSTAKSPQQMFGAMVKTYFAEKTGIDPENICCISIMPCVAKKREADLKGMDSTGLGPDVDIVLTTREFVRLLRAEHVNTSTLQETAFDTPMGEGTGAAVIFGVTGGVMEAALRTAYAVVEGKNPPVDAFCIVREDESIDVKFGTRREAEFELSGKKLKVCTVSGLKQTEELIQQIKSGEVSFDFVEVMSCPGGCVGGGGQPIREGCELSLQRGTKLYELDAARKIRYSHENPEVIRAYQEFLEKPLSHKAHKLLHV